MFERFSIGGHFPGLVTRLEKILLGLVAVLRAGVVMGQQAGEFVQAILEQHLDRLRNTAVDGAPVLGKNTSVGRLLYQCMLEDVLNLRQLLTLADELRMLEFGQAAVEVGLSLADDLKHPVEKTATDDRGQFQRLFDVLFQPVDARQNQALNRVRKLYLIHLLDQLPGLIPGIANQNAVGHQ